MEVLISDQYEHILDIICKQNKKKIYGGGKSTKALPHFSMSEQNTPVSTGNWNETLAYITAGELCVR